MWLRRLQSSFVLVVVLVLDLVLFCSAFPKYSWLNHRTFGRSESYPGVPIEDEDDDEYENDFYGLSALERTKNLPSIRAP